MPLPSMVTYNELDGTEVAGVLRSRFNDFLSSVPYFQKHLTLPRCRISFQIKLEVWADQPQPDLIPLSDTFGVLIERQAVPEVIEAETVDSSAPVPGGHPPDEIRDLHNLPITQPMRGRKEVGGQLIIADQPMLDGREVELMHGVKISRTGDGMIGGMPSSENATLIKIDKGPDGMRLHPGQVTRDRMHFGGGGNK